MPELPEVEVTRRRIEPLLVDREIAAVRTTKQSYFFITSPALLRRRLPGRRVRELQRRGKYLIAELDDESRLLLHLGMTGQLFAAGALSPRLLSATARSALVPEQQQDFRPDRHTHLRLQFVDGGTAVFFRDVRKFGKVQLIDPGEQVPRLERLGVDALEATGSDFHAAASRRRIPVKTLLLDQSVLAGVGNIYADEALYLAGITPRRSAQLLRARDCTRLVRALRKVLQRSIETGGSSIRDYIAPDGSDGGYQDERQVYGREGEPCLRCQTKIKRVVVAQRASHFCPSCQV